MRAGTFVQMSSTHVDKRIGRPPGADADRTRAAILDAALEAFADRGFDGASIREITGAAGVGHNLVRHYFGSKDDLWRATVHHALDPAGECMAAVFDGGLEGADETMRAVIDVLVSDEVNPAAVRLLVSEALRGGPRFDQIYDEVLAPAGDAFVAYFRTERESLADADPRVLGLYVFAAVFGALAFEGLAGRLRLTDDDGGLRHPAVDDLVELVLRGLLRRP